MQDSMDQSGIERVVGSDESFRRRNHAFEHLDQICAAYWNGDLLDDLSDQWGVSLRTIATWVYRR